ncbi:hypothetical protein BDW62DRAFT_199879 [Aspergillus aurantiobrunneus]
MGNFINAASPSIGGSDDDIYLFPEDYGFYKRDHDWAHDSDRDNPKEGYTDKLPKKQRVRGPDDTAIDQTSFDPLASQGPTSQYPRDAHLITPAANETDPLLLQILEMFPNISHTYVKDLITRHRASLQIDADLKANGVDLALCREAVYEEILEQKSYPTQDSENSKRKRENSSEDGDDWETISHQTNTAAYFSAAAAVLGYEFPSIPMQHIKKILRDKKRLYHTFLSLFSDDNLVEQPKNRYVKLKNHRNAASPTTPLAFLDIITRELKAAKKQTEKLQITYHKKKEEADAEKANEEEHIRTGNLIESADTQIGLMKYTLQCFDVSGCQAPFSRPELREVLGSLVMEKLDSLQQEDEIRNADLEGLEDCPFCSFKAVLPPVEDDREFRCENVSCRVVSCRLCKEKSHIPLTCEENKKDKGLFERHQVEEAMSKALIRKCPKCQVQIIKEFGCNKMQCTKCHTLMCYVCQKDITKESYSHFGTVCRQDDGDLQDRERREVQNAERLAIDKILAENPDITEEQIRVGHAKSRNNQAHGSAGAHVPHARAPRADGAAFGGQHRTPGQGWGQTGVYNQPLAQQVFQPGHYGQLMDVMGQTPPRGLGMAQGGAQFGNPATQNARRRFQNEGPQARHVIPPAVIHTQGYLPMTDHGGRHQYQQHQQHQRRPPENPNTFGYGSIFGLL